MGIVIGEQELVHLAAAIEAATGEMPDLSGYHGRYSRGASASLGYRGTHSAVVEFELAVILAEKAACAALQAGYAYGPEDMLDDLRLLVCSIDSPCTEAIGNQIQYYWPTVVVRG